MTRGFGDAKPLTLFTEEKKTALAQERSRISTGAPILSRVRRLAHASAFPSKLARLTYEVCLARCRSPERER